MEQISKGETVFEEGRRSKRKKTVMIAQSKIDPKVSISVHSVYTLTLTQPREGSSYFLLRSILTCAFFDERIHSTPRRHCIARASRGSCDE